LVAGSIPVSRSTGCRKVTFALAIAPGGGSHENRRLSTRRLSENDREHLRAALFEFGLECRPRHALVAIVIEGRHAVFKFGPLRISQRKLIVIETVPKLRNERKSLGRRQTDNLVVG
jgi:hypothetical protein